MGAQPFQVPAQSRFVLVEAEGAGGVTAAHQEDSLPEGELRARLRDLGGDVDHLHALPGSNGELRAPDGQLLPPRLASLRERRFQRPGVGRRRLAAKSLTY